MKQIWFIFKWTLKLSLLAIIAAFDIAEAKPNKRYLNIYEAQELFDMELISIRRYNEAFSPDKHYW
jgi:hypothetical protein